MFQINKMPATIDIGIIGETNFRTIKIDMSAWMQDTPDGVPSIVVIRPTETAEDAYIAATEFDTETNVLSWTITAGDLGENKGEGVMRIWLEEEDNEETIVKRGKSVKVTTIVNEDETMDPSDEPPEAQAAWMEQMTALKVATVEAAADADDAKDDAEAAAALSEGSAEDSEAYAIGKRNGEDVTSGDPAYHNNSKYYAIKAWEHAGDAENAKIDAVAAKNAAVGAKNDAVSAKNDAVGAKDDAVAAKGAAEYAQGKAEDAQEAAEEAQEAAETAQGAAEGSAEDSEAYAIGKRNGEDVDSDDPAYHNNSKYYAEQAVSTLSSKADKVSSAVSGNFAGLDSNGNMTDSGSKASDFLTEHQDISGKADKDTDAVEGNLAEFDSNGNPVDSGKAPTDFVAADDFYATEMPMSSSDSTKVSEAVSGLKSDLDLKADLIHDTVSNVPVASVPDATTAPLTALTVAIEPIQSGSGDPSPSNVRPITGRTAVAVNESHANLFDSANIALMTVDGNGNERYGVSIEGVGTYIVRATQTGNSAYIYVKVKNANGAYGSASSLVGSGGYYGEITKTLTEGQKLLIYDYSNDTESTAKTKLTSWGIYTATVTSHTAHLGQTVYGGYIDWVEGQMVIDHAVATQGKDDILSVTQASTGIWCTRTNILPGCTFTSTASSLGNVKSNMYVSAAGASIDYAVRMINGYPYVYNSELDTLAKAEEFYQNNPLQIWYPLATPITVPLENLDVIQPSATGQFNLWADSGDVVEMEYSCDTKLYIDKKLAELTALVLENG